MSTEFSKPIELAPIQPVSPSRDKADWQEALESPVLPELRSALNDNQTRNVISALPPVDGGKDAWLFLVAAFMIETLVWGLPFSVVRAHLC